MICGVVSAQQKQIPLSDSVKSRAEFKYDSTCNCDHFTEYSEDGKVLNTATYKNNVLHGDAITYFPNGKVSIFCTWKNGVLDGRMYSYQGNGKLGYEKFFADQFKTGTWKFWGEDGALIREQIYIPDKTIWHSKEDFMTEKFYYNNKLAYTVIYEAGKKIKTTVVDEVSYKKLLEEEPPAGKKLFTMHCSMCHKFGMDLIGPKLDGVTAVRTNEWLVKKITNSAALIKSGDETAIALHEKWHRMQHPVFPSLTAEEITVIVDYLKQFK